jgi:carbonic anhydrase/acetyltransferase-like protein (isoleucine patch superfamily)
MIAPGGSSNQWNSAYTTTNTNSAAWATAKININTAAGTVSNYTPSGSANVAIGFNSLASNSTITAGSSANYNVAIGNSSLLFLTAGDANVAVGTNSLLNATNIYNTVAVGVNALSSNTITNDNTAIGTGSLVNMTSGGSNIAVGYLAGKNLIDGNNNIFVGVNSSTTSSPVTASIALGRDATISSSNQLVIGSPSFPLTNNSIMYGGLSFTGTLSANTIDINMLKAQSTVPVAGTRTLTSLFLSITVGTSSLYIPLYK